MQLTSTSTAQLYQMSTTNLIITIICALILIVALWKVFVKAGRPGWAALIPIYDVYIMIKIAGLEWWYLLLLLVPLVNIYAIFKIYIEFAHKFGKSTGFGILSVFFSGICFLILAFGSAKYKGEKKSK